MAKINMSFDTVTKKVVVTIDGENVKNLSNLYLSAREDETAYLELATFVVDKNNDACVETRITASEKTDKPFLAKSANSQVNIFPIKSEEQLINTVVAWFNKMK